jgi:hypothetical protein
MNSSLNTINLHEPKCPRHQSTGSTQWLSHLSDTITCSVGTLRNYQWQEPLTEKLAAKFCNKNTYWLSLKMSVLFSIICVLRINSELTTVLKKLKVLKEILRDKLSDRELMSPCCWQSALINLSQRRFICRHSPPPSLGVLGCSDASISLGT